MSYGDFLKENQWITNILISIGVIFAAILVYSAISKLLTKRLDLINKKFSSGKKTGTYLKLFRSINRYLYIIIVLFIILKINGVNITAMVTGVGVIGIVFGFAIQDALKDVIKGFDIITDAYYQVGDVVRIDKYTGKVLSIGIKTTKLEDIYEHNIISISNRNIEKVEILSHMINIDIPLPYDLNTKKAEDTIDFIVESIKKIDKVEKVEYKGINNFDNSNIKYHIKVYCSPINKVQIRRDSLTCIYKCLEERKINIPFNQIDVHQK